MGKKAAATETDPLVIKAEPVLEAQEEGDNVVDDDLSEKSFGTRLQEVAASSFQLGLTAFGDTTLKIALIEDVVVEKGNWVRYDTFMELFALSQALPGPLATQVLMSSAMIHAGPLGAIVAVFLWALPGAFLLTVIGVLVNGYLDTEKLDIWLAGVAPATVALVIFASVNFAKSLDLFAFALATLSCFVALLIDGDENIASNDTKYAYPIMLITGGILAVIDATLVPNPIGIYEVDSTGDSTRSVGSAHPFDKITSRINMPIWGGLMILQLWLILLLAGIVLSNLVFEDNSYAWIFSRLFRIGSVVFSGEETVLPMLTSEFVPDWLSAEQFSHGLALTQAAPGSIFNVAAYIGAIQDGSIPMALLAVASIYLPSLFFLIAGIPIWARLRRVLVFKALLQGVNAVAIGFMGAICVFLWEESIERASDAMILVICLSMVAYYQISAPIVIATAILLGILLNEEVLNVAQKSYNSDFVNGTAIDF